MKLQNLRGKQANKNRWEALKMLDWEKDLEVIEAIFNVTNPLFFSKRTPQQIISETRQTIEFSKKIKKYEQED